MLSGNNKSKILVSKVAGKGDLRATISNAVVLLEEFKGFFLLMIKYS